MLDQLLVKPSSLALVISRQAYIHRSDEQVVRPKARIDRMRALQASNEETRGNKQYQRDSDLGDDQNIAQARFAIAWRRGLIL